MNQSNTSIQIDLQTRRQLKALKGKMTYDELLLKMIRMYKGRIERNKYRTPEKIEGMKRAVRWAVMERVTFGKDGRVKEIDLSD